MCTNCRLFYVSCGRCFSSSRPANANRLCDFDIKASKILLIDERGVNAGIVELSSVLNKLDLSKYFLMQVATKESIPMCKIMCKKTEKTAPKPPQDTSKAPKPPRGSSELFVMKTKTVEMNSTITEHDFNHKFSHVIQFLEKKARVNMELYLKKPSTERELLGLYDKIKRHVKGTGELISPKISSNKIQFVINPLLDQKNIKAPDQ